MIIKHEEEVIDFCIDNRISFLEAYKKLIENKLDKLEEEVSDFKSEVMDAQRQEKNKIK